MTDAGPRGTGEHPPALLWPVFAVSCGVLGFEITLMRVLLYASWHHFAFLVISIVLLGFGASGTLLCFLRRRLLARGDGAMFVLVLLTAVSMPVAIKLAHHIPVTARFVPALLFEQVARWSLFWLVLAVPFLLGGAAIGLALMRAGARLPSVYGVNLAGSAVGSIAATAAMHVVDPAWLAALMGAVAILGTFPSHRQHLASAAARIRLAVTLLAIAGAGSWLWLDPPRVRIDPYKYVSYVHRLVGDGKATPLVSAYGPRAVVETFAGDAFHDLPFLAVGESPPAIIPVVLDGHSVGSLLRADNEDAARVVDRTLMSFPYSFVSSTPNVLLLGESGGANIWLARRKGAATTQVVQPNAELIGLMDGPLNEYGGKVFGLPGVVTVNTEPRHFVERTESSFDLIQLVSMESWAVETGGVGGLNQDYLMTIQGLAKCLERLSSNGILAVGRGLQLPPRDNIKLLNTLARSLRQVGIEQPERHVLVVRDFLAACTMVKKSPWTDSEIDSVRRVCSTRELTPVYFSGIRDDELNRPDQLPGPADESGDWLHHAAMAILSSNAADFIKDWAFDVRAPTDDRPFFGNFTKPETITVLREAMGDLWLTRADLALLFVLVALALIALVGVLLTVLPLLFVRGIRRAPNLATPAAYFTAIGLAYLMLEITMLSRLIHLIGDPVRAGSATIAGFLLFSGLGSLVAQRVSKPDPRRVQRLLLGLVIAGVLVAWVIGWIISVVGTLSITARFAAAMAVIAPLGFLMGFPMPLALRRLDENAPALVPWAWGVNGFASVLAPPLATAIGMVVGFRVAGGLALLLYLVAATVFDRLPGHARGSTAGTL